MNQTLQNLLAHLKRRASRRTIRRGRLLKKVIIEEDGIEEEEDGIEEVEKIVYLKKETESENLKDWRRCGREKVGLMDYLEKEDTKKLLEGTPIKII